MNVAAFFPTSRPKVLVSFQITTTDRLDAHTLGRLPSEIRVIATYSVGHDHIDLPASQARGLTVINTPDVLTDAVAVELSILPWKTT